MASGFTVSNESTLDSIDGRLERFAHLVAAAEREKFCAMLRQLHDSYSLASNSNTIRARGNT